MKKLGLLGIAVLMLTVSMARADDGARREQAEELMELMGAKDSIERTFSIMKDMMEAQREEMIQSGGEEEAADAAYQHADQMMDIVASELSWDSMKEEYITLYTETFSSGELAGIIDFYKSPAGKAFLAKQPELMQKSMVISQEKMQKIMPRIKALSEKAVKESSMDDPAPSDMP